MNFDVMALANILRDAARAEAVPRFRRLDASMVHVKTEAIDLVTEADIATENVIKAAMAGLMPDALFVGEESVAADPALLTRLATADLAVVVDPIDGTANYAAGLPLFATMASVVSKGETVAGIIYDPMGDDWIMAEKGSGAWLRRPNGESVRLHVAAPLPLVCAFCAGALHAWSICIVLSLTATSSTMSAWLSPVTVCNAGPGMETSDLLLQPIRKL